MRTFPRKTAPKVRDGKVQRKNRWKPTPNCYNVEQPVPVIDRQRPGWGYRHLVRKDDLRKFIRLVPEWEEISVGLNVLILATGGDETLGWHSAGRVAICAWDRSLALSGADRCFYEEHRPLLEKLGVPCVRLSNGWELQFTENTARAFQLVHVFVHELGHHRDRMTTRFKRQACRGEYYAEAYARRYEDLLLARYRQEFPLRS